jgi:hypothetical protein
MGSQAHFRVRGQFDSLSRVQEATVTIDRETGAFFVRVKHRKKKWESTLSAVAQLFVTHTIHVEAQEKMKAKRKRTR